MKALLGAYGGSAGSIHDDEKKVSEKKRDEMPGGKVTPYAETKKPRKEKLPDLSSSSDDGMSTKSKQVKGEKINAGV